MLRRQIGLIGFFSGLLLSVIYFFLIVLGLSDKDPFLYIGITLLFSILGLISSIRKLHTIGKIIQIISLFVIAAIGIIEDPYSPPQILFVFFAVVLSFLYGFLRTKQKLKIIILSIVFMGIVFLSMYLKKQYNYIYLFGFSVCVFMSSSWVGACIEKLKLLLNNKSDKYIEEAYSIIERKPEIKEVLEKLHEHNRDLLSLIERLI